MEILFIQILAFLAVVLLVVGIQAVFRRQERLALDGELGGVTGFFVSQGRPMGLFIGSAWARAFPDRMHELQKLLLAASLAGRMLPADVVGMQVIAAVGCFVVGGLSVFAFSLRVDISMLVGLGVAIVGWMYPSLWLKREALSRQEVIQSSIPFAVDLLTVAMQAGQDFGAALRFLVVDGPRGPLTDEFANVLRDVQLGKSRADALKDMVDRVQLDELRSIVRAVTQSAEMGASVTDALRIQAEEVRRARFHRAERKAARAPSLMMIPVALLILPAVFIVILTPVIIRVMETSQLAR